jgi:hypothetical protein
MNDLAMHEFGIKNRMLTFLHYLEVSTPAADLAQLGADEMQRVYICADRLRRHAAILMDAKREDLQ